MHFIALLMLSVVLGVVRVYGDKEGLQSGVLTGFRCWIGCLSAGRSEVRRIKGIYKNLSPSHYLCRRRVNIPRRASHVHLYCLVTCIGKHTQIYDTIGQQLAFS